MSLSFNQIEDDDIPIAITSRGKEVVYLHKKKPDDEVDIEMLPYEDYDLDEDEAIEVYEIARKESTKKVPKFAKKYYRDVVKQLEEINEIRTYSEIEIDDTFEILPLDVEDQVHRLLITGIPGSGKSHVLRDFIKKYHQMWKNNPIYLFSLKDKDKAFDRMDYIHRCTNEGQIIEEDISYKKFANSLVIFDDVDALDKAVKKQVMDLQTKLLKTGREQNTYVCYTNHEPMMGAETKAGLSTSTGICFFRGGNETGDINTMKTKIGIDPKKGRQLFDIDSRWLYVTKAYPRYAITENKIMML